jgi:DNA-binding NtrC family response regulator
MSHLGTDLASTPVDMLSRATHIAVAEAPRPRVLIVDDEPLIRWSIAEALGERGYSVVEAGTGSAAIEEVLASSEPFCVIVLDLRLPDSDNLSLLTRLQNLAPDARIIMMTAHGTDEVGEEAHARGAYGFMNKPFEISVMASLVGEASRAGWPHTGPSGMRS